MFYEALFPTNISLGATGGSGWSTRIVATDASFEFRGAMWATSRGAWHVGHNLRYPAEWAVLLAFHRVMQGRTNSFRFLDWTDFTHESAPGVGDNVSGLGLDADGNPILLKTYTVTDLFATVYTSTRYITKPVPGTVAIFEGMTSTPRTGYTIDYTTGTVTVPGDVDQTIDYWTGQFHVPVRFDTDRPELSADFPAEVEWKGIPIVEILLPGLPNLP